MSEHILISEANDVAKIHILAEEGDKDLVLVVKQIFASASKLCPSSR